MGLPEMMVLTIKDFQYYTYPQEQLKFFKCGPKKY